jgi:serine-type D-Ala-D-Ala endopeptidase (penicillin-binding protein 7)
MMKLRLFIVLLAIFSGSFVRSACAAPIELDYKKLKLASANVLVLDAASGEPLYSKNSDAVTPIASITKLMTAIVVLDGGQPLADKLTIEIADIDTLKGSHSRLRLGAELSRYEMLRLALMSSENRAASALGRNYPGGSDAFVVAMNAKAQALGMTHTHYGDPTGLSSGNVSTAQDLAKLVKAAAEYPLVHAFTTTGAYTLEMGPTGRAVDFHNTNMLVRSDSWDIEVSKTGFIREAGRCLVMLARIASRPVVIVLLDSLGTYTRIGDANRVKYWLETGETLKLPAARAAKRGVAKGHFQSVGKPAKKVVRKYKRRT